MPLPFADALVCKDISIIAEVKKASPSKGLIRRNFDHIDITKAYLSSPVQALSVLTEQHYFQGNSQYLSDIRAISPLPLLRKDFIIDEYQIYEAYLLGADCILLIAALLNDAQLKLFSGLAHSLRMACLAEVHDETELERVLSLSFGLIGINNRSLHTFAEDISTTARLVKGMPKDKVVVSESGIRSFEDLAYVRGCGAHAALIGELFMRSDDIQRSVLKLRGITNDED